MSAELEHFRIRDFLWKVCLQCEKGSAAAAGKQNVAAHKADILAVPRDRALLFERIKGAVERRAADLQQHRKLAHRDFQLAGFVIAEAVQQILRQLSLRRAAGVKADLAAERDDPL